VAVRAIRGATQLDVDEREHLLERSAELVKAVLEANDLESEDLISILFTVTDDLRAAFPAEAARRMGMGIVPLLCAREIPVEGAMPSVVRVLMHFHSDRGLGEVVHVYLDGAEALRDDLDGAS
jgi:chorismate mutase